MYKNEITVYVDGVETDLFSNTIFPSGEINLNFKKINLENKKIDVTLNVFGSNSRWFEKFYLICRYLIDASHNKKLDNLNVIYFPYGRADRLIEKENYYEIDALKYIADFFALYFKKINTYDFHNILKSDEYNISNNVDHIIEKVEDFVISVDHALFIIPDKGFLNKIKIIYPDFIDKILESNDSIVICDKIRSENTIKTTISETINLIKTLEYDCIIIDDICDGGRTFIESIKKVREKFKNIKSSTLYTTFGIYSKGIDPLLEYFDNVECKFKMIK